MNRHTLVALALLLPAALAVTACGGGGEEGQIATTIEKATTGHDPRRCTELETRRFVEQSTGRRGAAAVAACEAEAVAGGRGARVAHVSKVSVDGGRATAVVGFTGGSLGSQALEVALVEVDGSWRLDRVEGFAVYDGKALAESFTRRYEKNPEGLSEAQVRCIGARIAGASKAEAEELFLSGSAVAIVELAKGCA